MLLINNVYKRWEDGYQMFCLFTLDGGGLVWVPLSGSHGIGKEEALWNVVYMYFATISGEREWGGGQDLRCFLSPPKEYLSEKRWND